MVRSVIYNRYFAALLAALLLVPFVAAHDAHSIERRDLSNIFSFPSNTDTSSTATSTSEASTTSTAASTSATSASSTEQNKSTQSTQASAGGNTSNTQVSQTSNSQAQTSASNSQPSGPNTSSQTATSNQDPPSNTASTSNVRSTSYSTNSQGGVVTVVETVPASALASGSSSSASPSSTGSGGSSSGISTGGIVGLSVAGGVALLAVIAFAVFKFSRKRYLDEYDDGEAIKWPELGSHGEATHALPTHRTGGAGFETSSEVNLTRPDSRAGSIAPSAAASAVDLYGAQPDPYAVPPLPHLNPNAGGPIQPYRDDPSATYYDPYSGPVPQTLGGEAIPMTQIPGRARSPMPMQGAGMGMGMAMDGRTSPGPAAALAPPAAAPAGMRSPSPGPNMAMRSMSPGPNVAYGAGPYA
ncbi:hypothetical protein DAEQUDRAFT_766733 [Daedalea quercina L-15889]|uniref:Mid2 domain-containing protein n=1 Tax=Daedalea quercina L-15889 TaxID=1314783 RepID=A0A165PAF7_9APHY|nr:hypothetical protein DAEQUDRAFT_766733 [Daedalea quercina L-15889]